jgi:hypothetical protein
VNFIGAHKKFMVSALLRALIDIDFLPATHIGWLFYGFGPFTCTARDALTNVVSTTRANTCLGDTSSFPLVLYKLSLIQHTNMFFFQKITLAINLHHALLFDLEGAKLLFYACHVSLATVYDFFQPRRFMGGRRKKLGGGGGRGQMC